MGAIGNFEHAGMIRVLIYLIKKTDTEPAYFVEIHRKTKLSQDTLRKVLDTLKNMDLITEQEEPDFRGRHNVNLTDKGKKIAKSFAEAHSILEEGPS